VACRHPVGRVWVTPGEAFVPRHYAGRHFNGQRRCELCRQVVPYGPATDTAETAIEVTAARIIADDFAYWPVMDGFDAWVEDRDDDGVRQHHDHPFFRAGWLAAAIAHHATEHGEG
jgi:hypothetical protein